MSARIKPSAQRPSSKSRTNLAAAAVKRHGAQVELSKIFKDVPVKRHRLMVDEVALSLRRPSASPLLDPSEAIAIGLSVVPSMGRRLLSPEGPEVRAVLLALKLAGFEILPR